MKQMIGQCLRFAMAVPRRLIPLSLRRQIVEWLGRHASLPHRDRLSIEFLRDFAERDPNACHRFLWANHLAYAETYRLEERFGAQHINETRHMLFADLQEFVVAQGIDPAVDVHSVFEVGCSLGYLLHHLETGLFSTALTFEGIDIDRYAIEQGSAHLAALGSKVRLATADVAQLDEVLGGRTVDVILCTGVLLYLPERDARELVQSILRHTGLVAVFAGLAHPGIDNASLPASTIRERDATFIHNIDDMVRSAGGDVVWRRWEGPRVVDSNTIYFIFARPRQADPAVLRET